MKALKIFTLLVSLLFIGCDNSQKGTAKVDDFVVRSGIVNRKLMLDGSKEVSTTFTFEANHDWKIIDYKGFTCDPSYGTKTEEGMVETVTAKPLRSNNTADTIRLSDLNVKMLSTRFVGISAYQYPQIRLPKGNSVNVESLQGSTATISFITNAEDVELIVSGDITASYTLKDEKKSEYLITITSTQDNNTPTDRIVGTIGFKADGAVQETKINVVQTSAIVLDRSVVMLPSRTGGANMLTVTSKFDINISTDSNLFTVTEPKSKNYVITANCDNAGAESITLGNIEISLVDAPHCKASIEVMQRPAKASQTIIVHFIGTALRHYFNSNVERMLEALSLNIQGNAQIIAITTDTTNQATMYELRYDGNLGKAVSEKVKELSLPTPYNASLFERNLREALAFAPADKYALVIGSHGLAWVPKATTESTARKLKHLGISSSLWERMKDAEMTRHIGDKEVTRYDITEVSSAISANNVKFDYILFDACFMSNVESVYELRNSAKYIIGSPCEVMGAGFPYHVVMPYMLESQGASYNLDKICSEYVNYYKSEATTPSACVALIETAELEALAREMKSVNSAGVKSGFVLYGVQYYEGQIPHSFYDLGDMVEQSCADESVAASFKKQLDKTVTSRYHTDRFYSAYGTSNVYYHDIKYYSGISTSAMVNHYSDDWQQTAWYKATH